MDNNSDQWYKEIFEKPLEEIKQDVFFRSDNFENEDWYDDFLLFTGIGICSPAPKNILNVQKALKVMGYETHVKAIKNELCIVSNKVNEKQITTPNRMER